MTLEPGDHCETASLGIDRRRMVLGLGGLGLGALGVTAAWRPGDRYTCMIDGKLPHIAIVSDLRGSSGAWCLIHNIGAGTQEEDRFASLQPVGHFRWRA